MSSPIIQSVDRQDVTGRDAWAFALLPGCHIVQLARNLLMANENVALRSMGAGVVMFALKMKPASVYVIRVIVVNGMAGSARVLFRADEQDTQGKTTASFEPVRSVDEIKACFR